MTTKWLIFFLIISTNHVSPGHTPFWIRYLKLQAILIHIKKRELGGKTNILDVALSTGCVDCFIVSHCTL